MSFALMAIQKNHLTENDIKSVINDFNLKHS